MTAGARRDRRWWHRRTGRPALDLAEAGDVDVTLFEAADHIGGRIGTSPFAGLDHVDEGADAFLARVPDAVALARRRRTRATTSSARNRSAPPCGTTASTPFPTACCSVCPAGCGRWRRPAALVARQGARRDRAVAAPHLDRAPTRSARSSEPDSATRSTSGSSTRSSGASTPPTPTTSSLAEVPQLGRRRRREPQRAARRSPTASSAAGTATAAASPIFATPRRRRRRARRCHDRRCARRRRRRS